MTSGERATPVREPRERWVKVKREVEARLRGGKVSFAMVCQFHPSKQFPRLLYKMAAFSFYIKALVLIEFDTRWNSSPAFVTPGTFPEKRGARKCLAIRVDATFFRKWVLLEALVIDPGFRSCDI
jgi:hypothetical protein